MSLLHDNNDCQACDCIPLSSNIFRSSFVSMVHDHCGGALRLLVDDGGAWDDSKMHHPFEEIWESPRERPLHKFWYFLPGRDHR